jgi:hypothetical protein
LTLMSALHVPTAPWKHEILGKYPGKGVVWNGVS